MKPFRSIVLFSILAILLDSCFDKPNYPVTPEIELNDLYLKVTPDISVLDTLVLKIDFKDGDGDLGLDGQSDADVSFPYNYINFAQKDGNGGILQVPTFQSDIYTVLLPTTSNKLITYKTRNEPGYGSLPLYDPNVSSCSSYIKMNLVIDSVYSQGLRSTNLITDTLYEQVLENGRPKARPYYMFTDTLYYTYNDNYYNITIDFLVKNNNGTFTKFDWRKEFCETYDGRFPVLSDNKSSALEGTIRYEMTSNGWLSLFSIKTLKLRISIKDRALNKSNVIETPEFTLDKIQR